MKRMIAPYLGDGIAEDAHRALVTACALAWNLAILERYYDSLYESQLRNCLDEVWASMGLSSGKAVLEELKQRKTEFFPDDRRFIVKTILEPMNADSRHLQVGSVALDDLESAATGAAGSRR